MAKYTSSFTAKGLLEIDNMTITEIKKTKDGDIESVYNFLEYLRNFDGKIVSVTIKEDVELEPIEEL